MKALFLSNEYPPYVYGGAGIHVEYLTKELAKKYMAVPFGFSGNLLNVAMTNPNNVQVIEFIERKSGFRVNPYMASEENINRVVDQYQDLTAEVSEALKNIDTFNRQHQASSPR